MYTYETNSKITQEAASSISPYSIIGSREGASADELLEDYKILLNKYPVSGFINSSLKAKNLEFRNNIKSAYNLLVDNTLFKKSTAEDETKIRAYLNEGNFEDAIKNLRKYKNRNSEWHFLYGQALIQKNYIDLGKYFIQAACRKNPANEEYKNYLYKIQNTSYKTNLNNPFDFPEYDNKKISSKFPLAKHRAIGFGLGAGAFFFLALVAAFTGTDTAAYVVSGDNSDSDSHTKNFCKSPYDILLTNAGKSLDEITESYYDARSAAGRFVFKKIKRQKKKQIKYAYNMLVDNSVYVNKAEKENMLTIKSYINQQNYLKAFNLLRCYEGRSSEWNFLYGKALIGMKFEGLGKEFIKTACSMDTENMEYRNFLNNINYIPDIKNCNMEDLKLPLCRNKRRYDKRGITNRWMALGIILCLAAIFLVCSIAGRLRSKN